MHAASSSARRARIHYRQSLHTLTYVILDEANGGIIRNLNHEGLAVQAVGAMRTRQRVRVRFELRHPRVKVDAIGEVVWADQGGQCGIRFLDLDTDKVRQINQWILGDLLDSIPSRTHSIFGGSRGFDATVSDEEAAADSDGLLLSAGARKVIQLQPQEKGESCLRSFDREAPAVAPSQLDWLSRPLTVRQMAWMLNSLIVVAALLLYSLIFLAVTNELPRWPVDVEAGCGAILFVVAFYWLFSRTLGGTSMGSRLARLAEFEVRQDQDGSSAARFR